jgi:acetoacetyl-CoA reductase
MAGQVQARFGAVDILVNCVNINRDKSSHKLEGDKWPSILDTHLDSLFNVIRNLIDGMIERRYGRIINISLISGQKDQPGQINCAAAKAGLVGFTRSLARELADQGVTVNMVSLGYAATSMTIAIPEEIRQRISSKIPVGRLSEPEEIAHTVAFLASEEGSNITGTDIVLSGGLSPPSRSPPSLRRGGGMKKNTPGPALPQAM